MHPGATDPRRRWPADRFGAVAAAAAERGVLVAVVGDAGDAELADQVVCAARSVLAGSLRDRVLSLADRVPLGGLVGVLAEADVVLGNDSGPRHLAAALGTPTVSVFWVGNVLNAGPFGRSRHRVLLGWVTRCPVCGVDVTQVGWTAERCEHDPSFVTDVSLEAVLEETLDLLPAG
jgi:ADP-heptose:LPS heptosyltransferase